MLYVAMTRARERLMLCGNLGRNRGLNWGDRLFTALGVNEMPPQPVIQALIGGVSARLAPLAHYVHAPIVSEADGSAQSGDPKLAQFADRLAEALLNGEPLDSVAVR